MTVKISMMDMLKVGLTEPDIHKFSAELREWYRREKLVESTKDHKDENQRWAPCPAPTAHPLIVSALNAGGYPDYEVVDDTHPFIEQVLKEKKQKLFNEVARIEQDEMRKLIPDGKGRLITMHKNRILMDDYDNRHEEGYERPKDDEAFMQELSVIERKQKAIEWWAAEQHSEIADLTEETIDDWYMGPLNV